MCAVIELERREEQRKLMRQSPTPWCWTCGDTSWSETPEGTVRPCACRAQRRARAARALPVADVAGASGGINLITSFTTLRTKVADLGTALATTHRGVEWSALARCSAGSPQSSHPGREGATHRSESEDSVILRRSAQGRAVVHGRRTDLAIRH